MLSVLLSYSTETALLNVHNGIRARMDKKEVTLLVLFDLSSVFDTIDHGLILDISWRLARSCSEENSGLHCRGSCLNNL